MDTLKHKAERAAFGVAIDGALKYVRRDREQALQTTVPSCPSLRLLFRNPFHMHVPRETKANPGQSALLQ